MTLENPPFCLILALTISHKKSKISSITNINHDVEVLVVRLGHINSNKTTLEYPESAIKCGVSRIFEGIKFEVTHFSNHLLCEPA